MHRTEQALAIAYTAYDNGHKVLAAKALRLAIQAAGTDTACLKLVNEAAQWLFPQTFTTPKGA